MSKVKKREERLVELSASNTYTEARKEWFHLCSSQVPVTVLCTLCDTPLKNIHVIVRNDGDIVTHIGSECRDNIMFLGIPPVEKPTKPATKKAKPSTTKPRTPKKARPRRPNKPSVVREEDLEIVYAYIEKAKANFKVRPCSIVIKWAREYGYMDAQDEQFLKGIKDKWIRGTGGQAKWLEDINVRIIYGMVKRGQPHKTI